jgi:hypothetical protein
MVQGEVKKGARWAPICQTRDASYFNGQVMAEISNGSGHPCQGVPGIRRKQLIIYIDLINQ